MNNNSKTPQTEMKQLLQTKTQEKSTLIRNRGITGDRSSVGRIQTQNTCLNFHISTMINQIWKLKTEIKLTKDLEFEHEQNLNPKILSGEH